MSEIRLNDIPGLREIAFDFQPACAHPTLTMTMSLEIYGRQYQCDTCKKKIEIPETTMIQWGKDAQENLAGILGLNFGEYWANAARRGKA